MKSFFVFYFLVFSVVADASDWSPPGFQDCSFYEKAEAVVLCRARGSDYLIGYGQYYCNEFKKKLVEWKNRPGLSEWTRNTGLCLQEMLFDNRKKRLGPNCSQLEEFAFDAHPICYKQYGICDLSISDKMSIFNVVRVIHLVTRKSVAQIDNVLLACLAGWLSPEENASYRQVYLGTEKQSSSTRRIAGELFDSAPVDSKAKRQRYFKKLLPELIFDSSTKNAIKASQDFLTQFKSDGTMASAAMERGGNDCLEVFNYSSVGPAKCEKSTRKKLEYLRQQDQTIRYQNTLTAERIINVKLKMENLDIK